MINPNKLGRSPFPRWQAQWMMAGKISTTPPGGGLADGDPVTTWLDSSVNGNNATQTGALRPTFKTNILNGKPVVRLSSAASTRLNLTTPLSGSATCTILAVMKAVSSASALTSLGSTNSSATFGPLPNSDGNLYLGWAGNIYSASTNDAAWHIFTMVAPAGNPPATYKDGTLQGAPAIAGSGTTGTFDVIGFSNSDGDIAELIVFNQILGLLRVGERANLEKYLGTKYGITVAGGSAVDPSTVTGLQAWWKADSLGT